MRLSVFRWGVLRLRVPVVSASTCALSFALACGDHSVSAPDAPKPPIGAPKTIRTVVATEVPIVGKPVDFVVTVADANLKPVAGVRIVVRGPSLQSATDSAIALTDSMGSARFAWVVPRIAGFYWLNATTDTLVSAMPITASNGPAARVEVGVDSIRFTRMNGSRRIPVRAFDEFGNPIASVSKFVGLSFTGPFGVFWVGADSVGVVGKSDAIGTGEAVLKAANGAVLARVKLNAQPVVASVSITGGLDALGLTVGESGTVEVVARDSGAVSIPSIDPAALGVSFASSNPSVASISAAGVVTGLAAGSTRISAQYQSQSYAATIPVVAAYDFGAVRTLYTLPYPTFSSTPLSPIVDSGGVSLLIESFLPHGGGTVPGATFLSWWHADGVRRWQHSLGFEPSVAFAPNEGVYIGDQSQLFAWDASGAELWRQPFAGVPVRFGRGVLAYTGDTVRAFAADGSRLWTRADPGGEIRGIVPSSDLVFVSRTNAAQALTLDGALVWSAAYAFTDAPGVVDEASTWYLRSRDSIVAIDRTGRELWKTPAPPNSDRFLTFALGPAPYLLLQSATELRAIDRRTAATLWSVPQNVAVHCRGACAMPRAQSWGNHVLTFESYVNVWDVSTGAFLGRSMSRIDAYDAVCYPSGLYIADFGTERRFDHC